MTTVSSWQSAGAAGRRGTPWRPWHPEAAFSPAPSTSPGLSSQIHKLGFQAEAERRTMSLFRLWPPAPPGVRAVQETAGELR